MTSCFMFIKDIMKVRIVCECNPQLLFVTVFNLLWQREKSSLFHPNNTYGCSIYSINLIVICDFSYFIEGHLHFTCISLELTQSTAVSCHVLFTFSSPFL
ncbi:hypothetical protein AB6A40_011591 [Gnathostoma spinigerum]|uniref:Uncharacterized protein n=1 Tax=Gnathostoma spinigerum TaxID=75299 RepID=A0ABD6F084_9BILA